MMVGLFATADVNYADFDAEITPEQFGISMYLTIYNDPKFYIAQMRSVREHVRAVIGAPRASGITDKEIDDASWEFYFDLDQTMDYILGKYIAVKFCII